MPAHDALHDDQFHQSERFKPTYSSRFSTVRVSNSEHGGYLSNLMTSHDQRGQGHGSALMAEVISDADRLGQPLHLHAREALHPWYGKMGFERQEGEELAGIPMMTRQPKRGITRSG